jgi:hypothetical protein
MKRCFRNWRRCRSRRELNARPAPSPHLRRRSFDLLPALGASSEVLGEELFDAAVEVEVVLGAGEAVAFVGAAELLSERATMSFAGVGEIHDPDFLLGMIHPIKKGEPPEHLDLNIASMLIQGRSIPLAERIAGKRVPGRSRTRLSGEPGRPRSE